MKHLYLVMLLCLSTAFSFAQKDNAADSTQKTSLTLAAIYSSNANYYGQTADQKLPFVLTKANLKFPGGLWLSGSAYKLLNIGSGISAADASVGVDFDLNKSKSLTSSISYTRSFYPENSPLVQSDLLNTASATLNYDWTWANTNLGGDYAFGESSVLFLTLSNSKLIDLGSVFNDKGYFTLEPTVEVVGGSLSSETETVEGGTLEDVGNENLLEKTLKKGKKVPFIRDKDKKKPSPDPSTTVATSTELALLSYNFKLPLAYNRSNYLVEASYQLSVLGEKVATTSRPRSFFNLSFYYLF